MLLSLPLGAELLKNTSFEDVNNDTFVSWTRNNFRTGGSLTIGTSGGHTGDKFAICQFDKDDIITDRTILAKVAENLLNIDKVEAAFVIANYEEENSKGVAISARSYKDINVQVVMEEMGGGGHLNGAATQIQGKPIQKVKEELVTILNRDFGGGDETMKVILLEDVKGRGVKNQVIDVASGYGNYLISNKKAIYATEEALATLKEQIRQQEIEEANQKKLMLKIQNVNLKMVY